MITQSLKNKLLFSLLFLGFTFKALPEHTLTDTPAATASPNKSEETRLAQEAQKLNALYAERQKQLDSLIASAQNCAQFIIMRKITPQNPQEVLLWIHNFMELARKASQIPHVPVTSYKLSRSLKINTQLIAALHEAHSSGFTSLPELDELAKAAETIEKEIVNPKNNRISLAVLHANFNENQTSIDKLIKTIQSGGITWYNRLYRNCVALNQKYHIVPITVSVTTATAVSIAALYAFPEIYDLNNAQHDSFLGKLQRWIHETKIGVFVKDMGDQNSAIFRRYMGVNASIASIGVLHQLGVFQALQNTWSNIDAKLIGATPINTQSIQYVNIEFTLEDKMFDSVRHLLDPFYQILKFLENPDLYIHGGQKIPKCVLLAGPPGSGKTHSALAFAGSIQKLYDQLGNSEKVGFIVMEPDDNIEQKILEAKNHAPCVLFIDELHLHNNGLQTTNGMWLSKMLTEIDKIDKTDDPMRQVFIVTATNRPDLLARALLRSGRFGPETRVNFSVPDYEQRKSVIEALCDATFIRLTPHEVEYLAKLTQDCAFSSINKVIERAAREAKAINTEATYNHIYEAFNTVVRGLQVRVALSEVEKNIIATHLSGAAIAHIMLDSGMMLDAITLKIQSPKIVEGHDLLQKMENVDEDMQHKMQKYGALFTINTYEHVNISVKDKFINAKLLLAGIVAQNVILGIESDYKLEDRQKAYESIVTILLRGLKIETLSKEMKNKIKSQAITVLDQSEKELKEFMNKHRKEVIQISEKLKNSIFLTHEDIKKELSESIKNFSLAQNEISDLQETVLATA